MRICRYVFVLMAVLAPFCRGVLARQGPQERHGQIIPCSSDDGEKHYCTADTRYGARLVRQRSQARCKEGGSWGYDEEGIWVDKGCGGEFTLGRGDDGGDARAAGGGRTVKGGLDGSRRKVCPAGTSHRVQVLGQRSGGKGKESCS